ncbi:MAG: hypothetical protein Fur0018_24470 [Anaerolineales bacterium]
MFRSQPLRTLIILGMAFLLGFGGVWITQPLRAAADASQTTSQAPNDHPANLEVEAPEGSTWVTCTPNNVAVFSERIHVKCNESYSGVRYFAYPTTNAAATARFLSLLTSAQVAGHTLSILYNPADTSGTAYGCAASDCRPFQAVILY